MSESYDVERMHILERIERGEINAVEGMRLLEALGASRETPVAEVLDPQPAPVTSQDIEHWKRWWQVPFAIGIVMVAFAGLLMLSAFQASGYGFWFYCLWMPFLLGVVIMALSWNSRTARWLHLRIHNNRDGRKRMNIAFSFPIPLRFTAWLLRVISPHIPQLRNTALDELILALDDRSIADSRTPLYVDVDEGEGERVQVYFG